MFLFVHTQPSIEEHAPWMGMVLSNVCCILHFFFHWKCICALTLLPVFTFHFDLYLSLLKEGWQNKNAKESDKRPTRGQNGHTFSQGRSFVLLALFFCLHTCFRVKHKGKILQQWSFLWFSLSKRESELKTFTFEPSLLGLFALLRMPNSWLPSALFNLHS